MSTNGSTTSTMTQILERTNLFNKNALEVKNRITHLIETLASQEALLAPSSEESKYLDQIAKLMISENTLRAEGATITKAADTKARGTIFAEANKKRAEISSLITKLNFTDKINIYSIKAKEIAAQHPQAQLDLALFSQAEKTVNTLITELSNEKNPAKILELFNKIKLQMMQSEIAVIQLEMTANSKTIASLIASAQNKKTPKDEQLKLIDSANNLSQRIENSNLRLTYLEQALRAQPLKSEKKSKAAMQAATPWKHAAAKAMPKQSIKSPTTARSLPTSSSIKQESSTEGSKSKPKSKR